MTAKLISPLEAEGLEKLADYRDEWLRIGRSTDPLYLPEIQRRIGDVYVSFLNKQPVPVLHFSSPIICVLAQTILFGRKTSQLRSQLWSQLDSQLESQLRSQLRSQLDSQLRSQLDSQLRSQLDSQLDYRWGGALWCGYYAFYEFAEMLGARGEAVLHELLSKWICVLRCTHFWWSLDGLAICSDRPIRISVDTQGRLHDTAGRMAVEYSDGWGVYAVDGIRLPDKYGAVKTKDWEPKWLLEEKNAELRMTLIKAMGYDRICQALEAKKLDSWREYELIRIENADVEPIHLLKMTCPSTGKIHALRVPPTTQKARAAITEINHGIDPEAFVMEH